MLTVDAPAKTIVVTRTLRAPVNQVYRAFTNTDVMKDWLADEARLNATVGGHLLLTWQGQGHAYGVYSILEENSHVAFSWRNGGEKDDSQIDVQLRADGDLTHLEVTHSDLPLEADTAGLERTWERRLDNLQTALETGADLRITGRVIMGVFPTDFNADVAAKLNVPVTEGLRIGNLIPGYSAEKAGLKPDDVVVEAEGIALTAQRPIGAIVAERKPGDQINIAFYREGQKQTATVTLLGYPVPQAVSTFAELTARVEVVYSETEHGLRDLFAGVDEATAARKAAPDEWSANEVLAHLIMSQRWLHQWIGTILEGGELEGWSNNQSSRITAITSIFATSADLLAELRRGFDETLAIIRNAPATALDYKVTLWWINFECDSMAIHDRQHFDQIRAALGKN